MKEIGSDVALYNPSSPRMLVSFFFRVGDYLLYSLENLNSATSVGVFSRFNDPHYFISFIKAFLLIFDKRRDLGFLSFQMECHWYRVERVHIVPFTVANHTAK